MMKRYTVPKGQHAGRPRIFNIHFQWNRRKIRRIEKHVLLPDAFRYDTGRADCQHDWNKLWGITFNPFKSNHNAVMLAGRWYNDRAEVTAYANRGGDNLHPPALDIPILSPGLNTWIDTAIEIDYRADLVQVEYGSHRHIFDVPTCRLTREINIWFGGNCTAPSDFSIYK